MNRASKTPTCTRCAGNPQEQCRDAKVLYMLRSSECGDNPLLDQFDTILRKGLTEILNVDLNDDQWLQASLPVRDGGLGIRSARMLAPSAFLASAASTLLLQQSIFPDSTWAADDQAIP